MYMVLVTVIQERNKCLVPTCHMSHPHFPESLVRTRVASAKKVHLDSQDSKLAII